MNVFISAASGAVPTNPPITRPPSTSSRSSAAAARLRRLPVDTVGDESVDGAAVALEEHVDHPGHQRHFSRTDERPVLEQRREIRLGNEIASAARKERRQPRGSRPPQMVERHEVDVEHRSLGIAKRISRSTARATVRSVIHGTLGCAGAPGGVA